MHAFRNQELHDVVCRNYERWFKLLLSCRGKLSGHWTRGSLHDASVSVLNTLLV